MAAPIQLGFFMPSAQMTASGPEPLGFERILEVTREAEEAGFHSLWWPDHYFIEAGPGQRRGSFECWTLLTALAARTSRIKLGSLVLCNTFRHPAVLAKQAASLQEISGGRVILGLGAGWHEPEYRALGLPFDHRVTRLAESATAIRELFDDGTSSFEGRWLKLDDAALTPRPQQKVPLLIAASGPNILRLTARVADSWNLAWFGSDPGRFAKKAQELREVCKEVGRDAETLELTVGVQAQVAAKGGEEATVEQIKQANPMLASLDAERLQERVIVGDAESVAGSLRGYADAGARLAIVATPGLAALPADRDATGRLFRDVTAALGTA